MADSNVEGAGARACWFVGASYGGRTNDQTVRFLEEGIWENGYLDRYLDLVKSIRVGDRIAIKSAYTRKHDLPFDSRGQSVSVMAIKATGVVTENIGDGRTLKVKWSNGGKSREWYFYTNRSTVWRVLPGDWLTDALIGFTFEQKPQDVDRFRNAPFWRERFGDNSNDKRRFQWTVFYEAVADKLLSFRNKREELVKGIHQIASKVDGLTNLQDQFPDGSTGPLSDICPFTTMGIFNRGITETNRKAIAGELAGLLGVTVPVPDSFEGIPVLNNQKSWFFGHANKRKSGDIDALWNVFTAALAFAESDDAETRTEFIGAYDNAIQCYNVKWNLTMGLYWSRPWNYLTLDVRTQRYIEKKLNVQLSMTGQKGQCTAAEYLAIRETLEARFQEDAYSVHSFPELSLAAWHFKENIAPTQVVPNVSVSVSVDEEDISSEGERETPPIQPYSIDDILNDGCFIARDKLEKTLERLRAKKNLILQGPPGTGKTWLAKRLAFALIGQRDDSKIRSVQFHPNLTYEDFIRGWRPTGEGKLALVDGPFVEMIRAAERDPKTRHVVVIEEINRGNPAQIFGEMLTLLEADKRTPDEALELTYKKQDGERVFIPDNLYLIGTMNIADRSLALVDLALRRRFAFIELEPTLGDPWRKWVHAKCGLSIEALQKIEFRISALNTRITDDSSLGRQYRIGHSYVTPAFGAPINDAIEWFRQVVETEIGPLLDEYWFDSNDKSKQARETLLKDL